ncbi:MAG: DnaA/Hda family protein [Bacteriovoracia bacterium]
MSGMDELKQILSQNLNQPVAIFFYGPKGIGKTTLLQKISLANKDVSQYISAKKLYDDFLNAIRNNSIDPFWEIQNSSTRLLFLDDCQIFQEKDALVEQLIWLMDRFYEQKKTIVLAGECSPFEISFRFADRVLQSEHCKVVNLDRSETKSRLSKPHLLLQNRWGRELLQ